MTLEEIKQAHREFIATCDAEIAKRTDADEIGYLQRMRTAVAEVLHVISTEEPGQGDPDGLDVAA